jgi:soluble lytic murein transglycosylase
MLILITIPASGVTLYPVADEALVMAAAKLRGGDIKGAREAAKSAPPSGMRDFVVGVTAGKLGLWEESATSLASVAETFPLLADYALYHQANALQKLGRYAEAQPTLRSLLRSFPDSRLVRPATQLLGDALFASGDFKSALVQYELFIDRFPAGQDSITALLNSALCKEQLGDMPGAAAVLRNIWLNNPASSVADQAEEKLQSLAAKGIKIAPYSHQDLYRRATLLFDLGKYSQSVKDLNALQKEELTPEFTAKVRIKTGQALYKARQYREAEKTFSPLAGRDLKSEQADEVRFWLAKTLDKNNKDEESFLEFVKLAETSPRSSLADDSLLEAAYIRKYEKNWGAELQLLRKFLTTFPDSSLLRSAQWEMAWGSFQAKDFLTAAEYFQKLTELDTTREKALYWLARAQTASGDLKGAQTSYAYLLAEYPLGYYALTYKKAANIKDDELSSPLRNLAESLPLPAGQERVKALITLGFYDEANKELAFQKKSKSLAGTARLYLEMENYAAAISTLKKERLRRPDKESIPLWSMSYPLAYNEHVSRNATAYGVKEGLVYAIIRAESSFSPTVVSPAGAIGLMQLMPATAASMSKGHTIDKYSLTRPELNIRLGTQHMKDLLDMYQGNQILAIAAYNAGAASVSRWQKNYGNLPSDEFVESITYGETREYVKKVLAGQEIYQRLYRLDAPPLAKPGAVVAQEISAR